MPQTGHSSQLALSPQPVLGAQSLIPSRSPLVSPRCFLGLDFEEPLLSLPALNQLAWWNHRKTGIGVGDI